MSDEQACHELRAGPASRSAPTSCRSRLDDAELLSTLSGLPCVLQHRRGLPQRRAAFRGGWPGHNRGGTDPDPTALVGWGGCGRAAGSSCSGAERQTRTLSAGASGTWLPGDRTQTRRVCISAHFSLLFVGPEGFPPSGYSPARLSISRGSST